MAKKLSPEEKLDLLEIYMDAWIDHKVSVINAKKVTWDIWEMHGTLIERPWVPAICSFEFFLINRKIFGL